MADEPSMSSDKPEAEAGVELRKNEQNDAEQVERSSKNVTVDESDVLNSAATSNDARTQLATLIKLVQSSEPGTAEPDHKRVVYEVFGTLVGGNFDLEVNFTIKSPPSLLILLELLQYCDASLAVELLGHLISILKRSITNLQICTTVGLIERILVRIQNETDVVADKFIELLGVLAAYSITVKELKTLFASLKGEHGRWPRNAARLLNVLRVMPDRRGPDVYFDFTGNQGAAITLPPIAKWPHQPGFTFCAWVCLDSSVITNSEQCRPYLYCFRTGKGIGYSAHFSGPMLVIESAVRSTKREIRYMRHLVGHQFYPQKWFMLTIVHTYSRFRSSDVKCYVNGQLVSGGDLTMAQMNEPLDKCYIGSSPSADTKSVFRGQLGAIYVFTDSLAWPTIQSIYHLGPGYKNKFKFEYEVDTPLSEQDRKILYDGKLASSIMFTYNPKACDGQLCLESSPVANASYFCESPHALMLEGVQAVVTHSLQTSLHSLGGVQMLFPLFAQLDYIHTEHDDDRKSDRDICTLLLSLLCDFLKNSETSQQQMIQGRGFYVISYLLEKCSDVAILTEEASDYLLALARFLLSQPRRSPLLGTLLDQILFNARLWINTPFKVQLHLFSVFATDLITNVGCPDLMRREVGVNKFIDMLRTHYWVVRPQDVHETDIPRPSKEELLSLRAFIMVLVKQMIIQGHGIGDGELESILCYLCSVKAEENIVDILQFILDLMCEKPMAIIMSLARLSGVRILCRFLSAKDEVIRIYSLKLIGAFLRYCPMQEKLEMIQDYSLLSLVGDKLKQFDLTLTSYNTLFEVLTGRVYKQIRFDRRPDMVESAYLLSNPSFVPIIIELILHNEAKQKESESASEEKNHVAHKVDIKRIFLSDLMLLLNHNQSNCRYFLQSSCWQDCLLSLAEFEPKTQEQEKTTDIVFSLIRLLLHHALQHEAEGWRIFVDSLAILHGQIFKRGLANKWANVIANSPGDDQKNEAAVGSPTAENGELRKKMVSIATVDIRGRSHFKETEEDNDYRKKFFYSIIQSKGLDQQTAAPAPGRMQAGLVNNDASESRDERPDSRASVPSNQQPQERTLKGMAESAAASNHKNVDGAISPPPAEQTSLCSAENETKLSEEPSEGGISSSEVGRNIGVGDVGAEDVGGEDVGGEVVDSVGGEDVGAEGVGRKGLDLGAEGVGGEGVGAEGVSGEDVDAEGVSGEDVGAEEEVGDQETSDQDLSGRKGVGDEGKGDEGDPGINEPNQEGGSGVDMARKDPEGSGNNESDPSKGVSEDSVVDKEESVADESSGQHDSSSEGIESHHPENTTGDGVADTHAGDDEGGTSDHHDNGECTDSHHPGKADHDCGDGGGHDVDDPSVDQQDNQEGDGESKTSDHHEDSDRAGETGYVQAGAVQLDSGAMAARGNVPVQKQEMEGNTEESVHHVEDHVTAQGKAHSIDISRSAKNDQQDGGDRSSSEGQTSPPGSRPSSPHQARLAIPEFLWSPMHQRLLADVLFAVESDLQVWKSHNRKTVVDFVNAKENFLYVSNLAFLISVLSDSMIFCCGDLLPLLSSATSPDFAQDVIQPCGGMELETAFSFLNRVMNLVDTIVYTSNFSFGGVEVNRNLSTGGFLRQCTRLALCCAARNRLVCRRRQQQSLPLEKRKFSFKTKKDTQAAIKAIIASTRPPTDQNMVQNMPGYLTTITDPDKLLQDMDVHRLRAAIYRDFEDCGHSQFLAVTVVYFVAVLTVSKYRDILEEEKGNSPHGAAKSEGPQSPTSGNQDSAAKKSRNTAPISLGPVSPSGLRSHASDDKASHHQKNGEMDHVQLDDLDLDLNNPALTSKLTNRMSLSERLELTFGTSGFLLREILLDFCSYLSKVLVGSHNQELLMEGLSCLKSESVVELVMLLCSQEWQNSLQRHAGSAFMDMINEGRMVAHSTRERLVLTTSEALFILQKLKEVDLEKHELFRESSDLSKDTFVNKGDIHDHITSATREKDQNTAKRQYQKIMGVITSEHGAWAECQDEGVTFQRLDCWQDDMGRRMRFVKNLFGSSHPEATLLEALETYHSATSTRHQALPGKVTTVSGDDGQRAVEEEEAAEVGLGESEEKEMSPQDHVVLTASCKSISPCLAAAGTLTVTTSAVYFSLDEEHPDNKKLDPKITIYAEFLHGKWSFEDVKAVFSRRYLLQNCGVEIFTTARTSAMFVFEDHQTARKVILALPAVGVGAHYGLLQSRSTSLLSPRRLFQKSNMTQKWQKGEITNFEYLMFINKIAGRTYNDLNQYPIFPWVLCNYTSENLDLGDAQNYRDLSKPIGALNPERLGQFLDRYNSWDRTEEIPPFHYGTHYSTFGFTLAWLIRLEPFASQFLNMQGGMFDHPGRTFSSMAHAWQNCQQDTSDVKELIPELYYLPEMFINSNRFQFGVDDDERAIDHVELPPWAKSPEDFVMKHRAALESDIVSASLHKWIDLIFGFKQRGVEAERAANVFYYLTYEGTVDLNSIEDSVMREAVEQQIKSFGQTPTQLVTEPHVSRNYQKVQEGYDYSKCAYLTFTVTPNIPVTYVALNTSLPTTPGLVTISCNQCFSLNKWLTPGPAREVSLRDVEIEQDPLINSKGIHPRRLLGEPLDQTVIPTASCFCVTADNRYIIACGYWDKSFKIFSADSGKLHQCVFGHWDVVTSLSCALDAMGNNPNDAILVSGSRDATLLVWYWNGKQQRISANGKPGDAASPRAILTGHETAVICAAVSSSLGLVVSGSQDGSFLIHSTMGDLLCTLVEPSGGSHPIAVAISNEGCILANYADKKGILALFSLNGKSRISIDLEEQVLVTCFSKDGNFFITGGFSKTVTVWRTWDMKKLHVFPQCDSSIRTLTLSDDSRCLVAGLASGNVLALEMEFSRWSLT